MNASNQSWLLAAVCAMAATGLGGISSNCHAQFIRVETPLTSVSDSYFERMGVDFGFNFRGGQGNGSRVVGLLPNGQLNPTGDIVFSQNSVGSAVPPFGGFDPNTQGTFGFGVLHGGGGYSLALFGGKGSTRSSTMTAPSIVVPNGGVGSIFSGQLSPFVTGINPVLGRAELIPPGYLDKPVENPEPTQPETYSDPHSSAVQGELSIDEIIQRRLAEQSHARHQLLAEIWELVNAANALSDAKRFGAARAKYSRALRKMKDLPELTELHEAVSAKLSEIKYER